MIFLKQDSKQTAKAFYIRLLLFHLESFLKRYKRPHLDQEEMNSKRRQASRELDVFHLGVDLRRPHQLLVLRENLLLDLVCPDVRLRQELL